VLEREGDEHNNIAASKYQVSTVGRDQRRIKRENGGMKRQRWRESYVGRAHAGYHSGQIRQQPVRARRPNVWSRSVRGLTHTPITMKINPPAKIGA